MAPAAGDAPQDGASGRRPLPRRGPGTRGGPGPRPPGRARRHPPETLSGDRRRGRPTLPTRTRPRRVTITTRIYPAPGLTRCHGRGRI
nr:MAG TPA: hypothetical protein [Caudoviricetes sp.]